VRVGYGHTTRVVLPTRAPPTADRVRALPISARRTVDAVLPRCGPGRTRAHAGESPPSAIYDRYWTPSSGSSYFPGSATATRRDLTSDYVPARAQAHRHSPAGPYLVPGSSRSARTWSRTTHKRPRTPPPRGDHRRRLAPTARTSYRRALNIGRVVRPITTSPCPTTGHRSLSDSMSGNRAPLPAGLSRSQETAQPLASTKYVDQCPLPYGLSGARPAAARRVPVVTHFKYLSSPRASSPSSHP